MAQMPSEFPGALRPGWLTARARNAARRPVFIASVGAGTFIAVLVALILAPQQVRQSTATSPIPTAQRDTIPLVAALAHARTRLSTAEVSLGAARGRARITPVVAVDTLGPRIIARRDSLTSMINDLDGLITRVETAPASASFRALAESPQLATNGKVRALLDSLSEVERLRSALGTADAADPVAAGLTTRSNEVGHAIQAAAQERRDALRQQISKLGAPTTNQLDRATPAVDTAAWIAERDSAQSLVSQADSALSEARDNSIEFQRALTRAQADAQLDAPPVALLAAALVFGVALGFGSAFFGEMRNPTVGDEHELERLTGTRVLATVRPRPRVPERMRRSVDRNLPPYLAPDDDGYQLTYLHVARAGASRLMLTIAGEDTGIAAIVATNVAAIAADEARSTIIIDTDSRTAPVAAALRVHAEPGFADIIEHRIGWPEVTAPVVVGRDRTIDVIPSGVSSARRNPAEIKDLFRQEATRLARHYEAIFIVAPVEQATSGLPGVLPIPDTVLCARVGHTRIADLQNAIGGIRSAGGNPVGTVLWNAPPPALPTPERIARARRPLNTPEMQSLTPSRS